LRSKGHGRDDAHTDDARAARVAQLKAAGLSDGMIEKMIGKEFKQKSEPLPSKGGGGRLTSSSSSLSSSLSSSTGDLTSKHTQKAKTLQAKQKQLSLLKDLNPSDDSATAARRAQLKSIGLSNFIIESMLKTESSGEAAATITAKKTAPATVSHPSYSYTYADEAARTTHMDKLKASGLSAELIAKMISPDDKKPQMNSAAHTIQPESMTPQKSTDADTPAGGEAGEAKVKATPEYTKQSAEQVEVAATSDSGDTVQKASLASAYLDRVKIV
jgi:hypothetical protein